MSYQVKLETFEGPLDLLLHLIRKNDMDIRDIEISKITDQYLEFLNAMRVLDVDLASEFIVMAATLIYIKSKMLLPKVESEETEVEMDPREALMQRLIEYQKYKMASETLSKQPLLGEDLFKVHVLPQNISCEFDPETQLVEIGIYELALAFQQLMVRTQKKVHYVEDTEMAIEDKIVEIVSKLNTALNTTVQFHDLFRKEISRVEIIVTFLAILELARLKCIKLYQAGFKSDIHLKVTEELSKFRVTQLKVSGVQLERGE